MAENGIYAEVKKLATRIANDIVKNHPMMISMAHWHSTFTEENKNIRDAVKVLELRIIQLEKDLEKQKSTNGQSGMSSMTTVPDQPKEFEQPAVLPLTARELKKIRGKYNFNQHNMAELLGVSSHQYSRWERGELDVPREIAADLRAFTAMPVSELRTLMFSRGIFQPNAIIARQKKTSPMSIIHMVQQSRYTSDDLKRIRTAAGLSQKTIAGYIGVPESTYTSWENNNARMPDKYTKKIIELQETTPLQPDSASLLMANQLLNRHDGFYGNQLPSLHKGQDLRNRCGMADCHTQKVTALAERPTIPGNISYEDQNSGNGTVIPVTISELRKLRQGLKLDQITFAHQLGVSIWQYKKWEQGVSQMPIPVAAALRDKFNDLKASLSSTFRNTPEGTSIYTNDLEQARQKLKMSNIAFAKEIGISGNSYSIWKKVNYEIPARFMSSAVRLIQLADSMESKSETGDGTISESGNTETQPGISESGSKQKNEDPLGENSGKRLQIKTLDSKRQELGLPQEETSRRLGISRSTYNAWLKNNKTIPMQVIRKAMKIMSMSVQSGTNEKEPVQKDKTCDRAKPSEITSNELKVLREKLNLTQRKMAEKFKVTYASYQNWELGKSRMPEIYTAKYRQLLTSLTADVGIPEVNVIPPEPNPKVKNPRVSIKVTSEMRLTIQSAKQELGVSDEKMGKLLNMDAEKYNQLESGAKETIRKDQWDRLTFLLSLPKNRRDAFINGTKDAETKQNV